MMADLKAVAAYNLPPTEQVAFHFPYASKVFLGYYLPLFTSSSDDNDDAVSGRYWH